jgi:photosystem II stability/assembly factor-like uncharacterized protein
MFIVLAISAHAQTFQWQHPTPTGNNINDAVILPSGAWIMAGDAGTVLRSTNNGVTWTVSQPETSGSDIYETTFVNENVGYFCTTNGSIMKTTNGGITWEYLNSGTTASLWYLDFLNADTGLVVGASSNILRTTNGGTTWTPFNLSTSTTLYKVHFVNASTAYIGTLSATVGRLLKTTDCGQTWNNVTSYTGTGTTRGVFFYNADTGWVTNSSYQIFRTTDGGATFEQQASLGTGTLYEIKFIDASQGVAIGGNGDVFLTTNGGAVWTPSNIGYNSNVFSLGIAGLLGDNPTSTLLVGGVAGAIASSTNWGATWTGHTNALARQDLREVQFVNGSVGYAVGGSFVVADSLGIIMKTTNGGNTWSILPFNPKHRVYSNFWIDADTGFITSIGPTGAWKTTNGGASFTRLNLGMGVESSIWYSVQFLNSQVGYVAGSAGFLAKTTNGGATWVQQTSGHGLSAIYNIFLIDNQNAVTTGGSGRVFKTTNGGAQWFSIGIGGTTTVYSSWWHNPDTGFVSGSSGTIRITTNGGTSWSPQTIATTATLYRIHFTDLQNGWVSGTLGSLFRTTNGGATWERVTRIVSSAKTLYDFDLTANALHAVGTDATIVYANLGPVSVDDTRELLPTQASLLQNYPNPFNPVTNFQFSIANSQLTILKVYDLLGREAVTLVNEVKQPGSYEVTWDAAGYSSGVYFSRLRVGEFTAVRKLLLLR